MIIMEREPPDGNHEMFSYLFHHDSPDNRYYRWRVFAFAQGDNFRAWRTQSFRLCDDGPWWRPPHCEVARDAQKNSRNTNFSTGPISGKLAAELGPNASESGGASGKSGTGGAAEVKDQSEPDEPPPAAGVPPPVVANLYEGMSPQEIIQEKERCRLEEKATQERQKRDRDKRGIAGGRRLSDDDWDRLERLLRNLEGSRASILEAMAFCLDKSDWSIEITECITESLTIVETDMAVKVARLQLVSDILHNTTSTKPSAWAYRREFEKSLPDILEHLYLSLMRVESKIDLIKFRNAVLRILHVWEDWGLFAPQYTRGLEAAVVVGVKNLRNLRSKGDASREPAWLELKLNEWRRQHFSQLEKMCRTRGLRSSTSHLEANHDMTLEEARRDWLVDRLVCYELHWHEREANPRPVKKIKTENLDGEVIECDIDGFQLEESLLDGEYVDLSDLGVLMEYIDLVRMNDPVDNLGGCVLEDASAIGGGPSPSPEREFMAGLGVPARPPAPSPSSGGEPTPPGPNSSPSQDEEDQMAIEKLLEDPSALEIPTKDSTPETLPVDADRGKKEMDKATLRDIDLEVDELRASLEIQGLFRDAIKDICDEKRQRLIEEHTATLDSPMNAKDGEHPDKPSVQLRSEGSSSDSSDERQKQKEQEQEQLKSRKATFEREKEREDKERERAERKEREKEKKEKAKEKDKEKDKEASSKKDKSKAPRKDADSDSPQTRKRRSPSRDRARDKKEKDKDREKDKEKEKDKDRGKKRVSRSRSKEQTKKKGRR